MARTTILRPTLAFVGASVLGCMLGACLTLGLVAANGFWEWPFLGQVGAGLAGVGVAVALLGAGPIVTLAAWLGRLVKPPRPAADIALGALVALALLLALRALVFSGMSGEAPQLWPSEVGPILAVPLAAGAAAGWLYWLFAGRPAYPATDE